MSASIPLTPSLPGPSSFQDPWILVSIDTCQRKFLPYLDTYIDEYRQKFLSCMEVKGLNKLRLIFLIFFA